MKKYNLYLTKRSNISVSAGGKLVTFTPYGNGVFAYSTDDQDEIKDLEVYANAKGGSIYVDSERTMVESKLEFSRAKETNWGGVKSGGQTTSDQKKEGQGKTMVQEEAKTASVEHKPATPSDLGQAVSLKDRIATNK